MSLKLFNRVKESSSTLGTGTLTLNGAAAGYQSFSSILSNSDKTYYTIVNGVNWEVGIGTYSTNTLSRDTVLSSSNSNAKIDLVNTSSTDVFIAYPAEKSVYLDLNSQVIAGSSGIIIDSGTPPSTTNALYNLNGLLYFNGVQVNATSGSDTLQSVTDRGSSTTNSITSSGNLTAVTGILNVLDLTLLEEASYPAHQEGVVFYDSDNHTLSLYNDEADVTLQMGQELFLRVRNETGYTINNGQVVKINGSHGNAAPTIDLAIADTEVDSQVVGVATHDIENSSFGYITTYGLVRSLNTSAFSAGDELYLDASTSGAFVNTAPIMPNYKITIGHVVSNHVTNGSILVQVGNAKLGGGDLKSINPVNISGVPFVSIQSDNNAGGVNTDSSFVYDSGNNILYINNKKVATSGDNVSIFSNDIGYLTSHPSIASASSSDNSGRTYIQDILLDTNGHVTGISTATETGAGSGTTYTAGSGLTLVGSEFNVYGGSGHFVELDVEGPFTATTKSFLIDHPSISGMKLQYGSLEGPENGVYYRGVLNCDRIDLPTYWYDLVDENSISVHLTPHKFYLFQPYVVEADNKRINLNKKFCGSYIVYGERKDTAKLEVEWWE